MSPCDGGGMIVSDNPSEQRTLEGQRDWDKSEGAEAMVEDEC